MTPFTVGLTGGIASGKSTVGRMMRELGWTVIDADRLVAELYRPDQSGAAVVHEMFGAETLEPDGSVDHAKLAAIVFSDSAARKRLEAAIHPLVGQRFFEIAAAGDGVAVFEAPLLAEGGLADLFDRVVTVEADPEERVRRAVARGLSEAEARRRFDAQVSDDLRRAIAQRLIVNDGSLEDLQEAVAELVAGIEAEIAGLAKGEKEG